MFSLNLLTSEAWLDADKDQGDGLVPVHQGGGERGGVGPSDGHYVPGTTIRRI